MTFGGGSLCSRGGDTFKKLSKIPILLGRVRLLAEGHCKGVGECRQHS